MTKILNHINTYADLTAYDNDKDKNYPNIAYIQETNEVKWVKEKPDLVESIVVCKYNVTSTSEETFILGSTYGIKYHIIDDVKQDTVKDAYTFDTLGEHTVKYVLDGRSIYERKFEGCTALTSITIPNSITSIDGYAFASCTSLTSVEIPNSVTSIGELAFYECSSLTSIVIPNSVTSISAGTFEECSGLITITIPDSVTSISAGAFRECSSLTSITIKATTPPSLGSTAFEETNNCPIYVPAESVDAYKTATNWSSLANRIQAIVA